MWLMLFLCLVAQLGPALCDPMGCSPPGSSARGISQARTLEWVAMFSSGGSSLLPSEHRQQEAGMCCSQITWVAIISKQVEKNVHRSGLLEQNTFKAIAP